LLWRSLKKAATPNRKERVTSKHCLAVFKIKAHMPFAQKK